MALSDVQPASWYDNWQNAAQSLGWQYQDAGDYSRWALPGGGEEGAPAYMTFDEQGQPLGIDAKKAYRNDLAKQGYVPLGSTEEIRHLAEVARDAYGRPFYGNTLAFLNYGFGPGTELLEDPVHGLLIKAGDPKKALEPSAVIYPQKNNNDGFLDSVFEFIGNNPQLIAGGIGGLAGSAIGLPGFMSISTGLGSVADYVVRGALQGALGGQDLEGMLKTGLISGSSGAFAETISPVIKEALGSIGITDANAVKTAVSSITAGAREAVFGEGDPLKAALNTGLQTGITSIAKDLFPKDEWVSGESLPTGETLTQAPSPVEEAPYTPADIQPVTQTYGDQYVSVAPTTDVTPIDVSPDYSEPRRAFGGTTISSNPDMEWENAKAEYERMVEERLAQGWTLNGDGEPTIPPPGWTGEPEPPVQYAAGEVPKTDVPNINWKPIGEGITKEKLEQYAADPNSGITKDENGYFIIYGKSIVSPDGQYVADIDELPVTSGATVGEGTQTPISTGQSIYGAGYGSFISPGDLGGFVVIAKNNQSTVLTNPQGFTLISYANGTQQLFDNNQIVIPIEELPRESQQEIQKVVSETTGGEPASSAEKPASGEQAGGYVSGEALPTGTTPTEEPTSYVQQPSQPAAGEVAPTSPITPLEPVIASETGNYEIPIFNPYAPPSSATQPATPGVPGGEATTYGTTGQEYAPYVPPAAGIPNQQDVAAPGQPSEEPYRPGLIGDITYGPAGPGGTGETFGSAGEAGPGGPGGTGDVAGGGYGGPGGPGGPGGDGLGGAGGGYGDGVDLGEPPSATMPPPEPGETFRPPTETTAEPDTGGGFTFPSFPSQPGYTSPAPKYSVSPATTAYLARSAISTPEITGSPVFGAKEGKRRKVWNIESLREALGV